MLRFGFPGGLFAALVSSVLSGCGEKADPGPPRAAVSGAVTFDSQPVAEGTITFIPTGTTKGPSSSTRIAEGRYTIDAAKGVVIGRNRVEVTAVRKTGKQVEAGPPNPPGTMVEQTESYIPARYNSSSELAVEIKAGGNDSVDFPLKKQ